MIPAPALTTSAFLSTFQLSSSRSRRLHATPPFRPPGSRTSSSASTALPPQHAPSTSQRPQRRRRSASDALLTERFSDEDVDRILGRLNAATADGLSRVPRCGGDVAARVVQHRDRLGGFTALSQLLDVHGCGPRLLDSVCASLLRHHSDVVDGSRFIIDRSRINPRFVSDQVSVLLHNLDLCILKDRVLVGNGAFIKSTRYCFSLFNYCIRLRS